MKSIGEIKARYLIVLLVLCILLLLMNWLNSRGITKYKKSTVYTKEDLNDLFHLFSEKEGRMGVQLVQSNRFWYRPIANEIGVPDLESRRLVDVLAFLHELYHLKDRARVRVMQSVVSLYTLLSVILKVVSAVLILLQEPEPVWFYLLLADFILLLICGGLTWSLEEYASRQAIAFLLREGYLEKDRWIRRVAYHTTATYLLQYAFHLMNTSIFLCLVW